jgi:hypothetical protein
MSASEVTSANRVTSIPSAKLAIRELEARLNELAFDEVCHLVYLREARRNLEKHVEHYASYLDSWIKDFPQSAGPAALAIESYVDLHPTSETVRACVAFALSCAPHSRDALIAVLTIMVHGARYMHVERAKYEKQLVAEATKHFVRA